MNLEIRYFLSIFWRRLPIFVPIVLAFSVAAVAFALSLPARYQSETQLLVESPQIDEELASSTVQVSATEQLQVIEQRLMTRANLLRLARKHNVYEDLSEISVDTIVARMRSDSSILRLTGRNQAAIMTMQFEASSAAVAAGVLNDYVTLVLEENNRFRKGRATDTLEFFEAEVERLSEDLTKQSAQILSFKSENSGALPATLEFRLNRQGQLLESQSLNERERLSLLDQRRRLQQVFELAGANQNADNFVSPERRELDGLQAELQRSLMVFSEANPKVKLLRARIAGLEEQIKLQGGEEALNEDPREAMLEIQLSEIDDQISTLEVQRNSVIAELDSLTKSIEQTAGNAIVLEGLEREYSIVEAQYNAAVARLSAAATGERIEVLSKGERISVVEQPSVPSEPTSPKRRLIAMGGGMLGVGIASALVVLLELLNQTIRRPADLSQRFGITPLGVLPIVRSPGDRLIKGSVVLAVVLIAVIGLPVALFMVHTYYLPLDLIVANIIEGFGS